MCGMEKYCTLTRMEPCWSHSSTMQSQYVCVVFGSLKLSILWRNVNFIAAVGAISLCRLYICNECMFCNQQLYVTVNYQMFFTQQQ